MSNEVAENLREIASNLLAAANRLDGIDVSADAMRSGTATPEQAQAYLDDLLRTHRPDLAPAKPTYVPGRYALTQGVSDWVSVKCADCGKAWMDLAVDLPAGLAEHDAEHRA